MVWWKLSALIRDYLFVYMMHSLLVSVMLAGLLLSMLQCWRSNPNSPDQKARKKLTLVKMMMAYHHLRLTRIEEMQCTWLPVLVQMTILNSKEVLSSIIHQTTVDASMNFGRPLLILTNVFLYLIQPHFA